MASSFAMLRRYSISLEACTKDLEAMAQHFEHNVFSKVTSSVMAGLARMRRVVWMVNAFVSKGNGDWDRLNTEMRDNLTWLVIWMRDCAAGIAR